MTAPPRRKVSLAQVNFQLGPSELNSYHLPYTAGCLWAMAQGQPDIAQTFELNQLLWRREDIPSVAARLAQDTVVGFCTYVWNLRYNLALARRLRAINPQCMIVFGGPEPAVSDITSIIRDWVWWRWRCFWRWFGSVCGC